MSFTLNIKQKFFLVLVVPMFCLGALEVFCRLLPPRSTKIEVEMPTWLLEDENGQRRASLKINPEELDWMNIFQQGDGFRVQLIPNIDKVVTNTFSRVPVPSENQYRVIASSLGFRSAEISKEKKGGVFRILIFGDSSSYGWGVNAENSYGEILKKILEENFHRQIEVGNFAIPGDSSEYGRLIFEKYSAEYHPDFIILGFGANDSKPVFVSHTSQVDKFRRSRRLNSLSQLANYSALFKTMKNLASPPISKFDDSSKKPAVSMDRFKENLVFMAKASDSSGKNKTLILSICTPGNYAAVAQDAAKISGALYLNGQKLMKESLPAIADKKMHPEIVEEIERTYPAGILNDPNFYISSDACHPNRLGHLLIAEKIAKMVGEGWN